ncbi:cupin domain-containing protein [Brevibacillus choshinensis]|uniref:Cupin domain-containing protein n=1 Tax=Brevibacillus choshinensis TaxID=54911 RepID=A0ABX7FMW1_BRECH|nr:cupin domain-containing protein [Brevibacillus choshinensis]QRG67594.1 cupin domain-containing protein [Brevibacillus choshinensis]
MANLSRTVGNPHNGESVTFIKTTEETNGEYLLFRTDLPPNIGIFLHYHTELVETFEGVSGKLDLTVDGKKITLQKGDKAVAPLDKHHFFQNNTNEMVSFNVEIRPAAQFEAFVRCGYGLDTDGRSFYMPFLKQYLPKNILLLGTLFEMGAFYVPYLPLSLQKAIFGMLAKLSAWTGAAKTLEKYYIPSPENQRISS